MSKSVLVIDTPEDCMHCLLLLAQMSACCRMRIQISMQIP